MASKNAPKTPKYETKIHLPEIPGSFAFRKNGKYRLDQQVKKFCLLNQCVGCFETKVHFGRWVNANKINYDAKADGIYIDTLKDQQKYQLFVPYPEHITLAIPDNPEAQFFCGVLSCKLAITKYDKKHFLKQATLKNTGNGKNNKSAHSKSHQIGTDAVGQDDDEKMETQQEAAANQKQTNSKKKKKTKRKLSMTQLNKKIAQHAESMDAAEPPKKKQKKEKKEKAANPNEMSVNAQYKLIDGVVDQLESVQKEAKRKELDKDADIREYMKQRAEKKKRKEAKREEIRRRFQERREKKRKQKHNTSMKTPSERKVKFAV